MYRAPSIIATSKLNIKSSIFISIIFKVDDKDEVDEIIRKYKRKYNDATHICKAFIIDELEYWSDSGEPSGSAGLPILNAIKKNNLNHTLVLVVRYFGGKELGVRGLIDAYHQSSLVAIENAQIKEYEKMYTIRIVVNDEEMRDLYHLFNKFQMKVVSEEFNKERSYICKISENQIINFPLKYELIASTDELR